MTDVSKDNILDLLIQFEHSMNGMYVAFAASLPKHSDLWKQMSSEELMHAKWLSVLKGWMQDGRVQLRPGIVSTDDVAEYAEEMDEYARQAAAGEMGEANAFAAAYKMETTIVEKRFYDVIQGTTDEVIQLIDKLSTEAQRHCDRVRSIWESFLPGD